MFNVVVVIFLLLSLDSKTLVLSRFFEVVRQRERRRGMYLAVDEPDPRFPLSSGRASMSHFSATYPNRTNCAVIAFIFSLETSPVARALQGVGKVICARPATTREAS